MREAGGEVEVDVGKVEVEMERTSGIHFNVAKVKKPLASAARVVAAGNRVVMVDEPGKSFIENVETKERIPLRVEKGTYVFDVEYENGQFGVITLDSGAGVNVWPEGMLPEVAVMPKREGLRMTAANGTEIENLGTKLVRFKRRSDFRRRA